MSLNCGIVGLPNVGKSTIFSALTSAPAEAANYPFCTIDPNIGIVNVPDERLYKIADIFKPDRLIPAIVEFVDIAGLVQGASKGEGLGNQFLGHIRQVGAIIHVVRCFENPDITHVHETIDPDRDIEIINIELALADLQTVEKRLSNLEKQCKNQNKKIAEEARYAKDVLEKISATLSEGLPARTASLNEKEQQVLQDLHLVTMKKMLYACNVDEEGFNPENQLVKKVYDRAEKEGSEVVLICGKIEAEIAALESKEEKQEFMESMGISESGLTKLIHAGYKMLGLETFFTAGTNEVKAWTFKKGSTAPMAAGIIHNDFQRGFIKAEVYSCEDLFKYGTETAVRENGKLRIEGKEYIVKDGDVIFFRFNV